MKRLQTRAAAAALSALLLALPTCALAAETAPLTLSTQQNAAPVERRTDLGQLSAFGRSHTYMGVSVSDEWLYQARIGGLPLGLSLFTPEGDGVTFRVAAKQIGVPERTLVSLLIGCHYLYRCDGRLLPYADKRYAGLFVVRERRTLITPKGKARILELLDFLASEPEVAS